MDCVKCGGPLPAKSNLCAYCNTLNETDLRALRQPSRHGELGKRPCPKCQKTENPQPLRLVRMSAGEWAVEVDRCDRCFGIFFDIGELETILEHSTRPTESVDHQRIQNLLDQETPLEDFQNIQYVPCPDCAKLMNRSAYGVRSGVIVDRCRDHGIWLDGGELKRLLTWTQAGGKLHTQQRQAPPPSAPAAATAPVNVQPLPANTSSGIGDIFAVIAGLFFDLY